MSLHNFKFIAINGIEETEITADSIKLVCEDGQKFELSPRRSDGEITIYADGQLGIKPVASNCIRITDNQ